MFFLLTLLLVVEMARAERFESTVHAIERKDGEETLVLFENGRVGFLPADEGEDFLSDGVFEVELDSNLTVLWATMNPLEEKPLDSGTPEDGYSPTVLSTTSEASSIFSQLRQGWQQESQCYNRAHVWAYEAYQKSQLKSIKLFLFFTSRYIRNYRFKWWFHVAPMTLIRNNGNNYPKVLDRRYTSGPRDLRSWTNIFMKSRASCPLVRRYSDYRNHQNSQDCYLLPASMYYYQPRDLERLERTGRTKTSFLQSEVNWAYREAFKQQN